MFVSRTRKRFIIGVIFCGLIAFGMWWLSGPSFETRWRELNDGMSQTEVRHALGVPTSTSRTMMLGAGGKGVTRWEYKRGRWSYCVDFDYTGFRGAALVFRTERIHEPWEWPSWWPWRRAMARA
jgi:hypothetical protein